MKNVVETKELKQKTFQTLPNFTEILLNELQACSFQHGLKISHLSKHELVCDLLLLAVIMAVRAKVKPRRVGGITKKEGRITKLTSVGSRPKIGCLAVVLVWCILAPLLVLSLSLDGPWK